MRTIFGAALAVIMLALVLVKPAAGEIEVMLEKIRAENELPALGGLVIIDGEVKAVGAVGLRKFKGKEEVTTDDKWHIGSCTKSMTATLAATFVEEGKLGWDSTVSEVLGGKVRMRDEYKDVTLKTLVSNRSGIPSNAPLATRIKAAASSGRRDIEKRRRQYAEGLLKLKPEFEPGTEYGYSNSGFVVAGVMLETVSGQSWEELMQERIFKPLGMGSAGFGGAATRRKEDQPWGHQSKTRPQPPGAGDDNPDVIGPAGTVHCSLADLARYVKMHLEHEVGPVLKKPESFTLLQAVADGNDDYACGWVVADRAWANGPALWHNGSNTMNYCLIWMAPGRKFGAIAVSNVGPEAGRKPCDAVIDQIIEEYLPGDGAEAGADKGGDAGSKVSPFAGLRWQGEVPVVKIGSDWFKLVSLDGIATGKIVAFSQQTHGSKWQMRIGEDLIEVLDGMGHHPEDNTVQLVVEELESPNRQTLERVAMTKANRDAIRSARTAGGE
ncbi:MAG: serine hydrolase domain-containing protein [Verrucomicrobiales bacterium]